jgi:hypothetical protein
MDERAWRRVKEIFHRALGVPPGERAALIERECGDDAELRAEVEAFLESHDEVDPAVSGGVDAPSSAGDGEGPGAVIDRYKLLQQIG